MQQGEACLQTSSCPTGAATPSQSKSCSSPLMHWKLLGIASHLGRAGCSSSAGVHPSCTGHRCACTHSHIAV